MRKPGWQVAVALIGGGMAAFSALSTERRDVGPLPAAQAFASTDTLADPDDSLSRGDSIAFSTTVDDSSNASDFSFQPREQERRGRAARSDQSSDSQKPQRGLLDQMTAFKTDVPTHDLDVVLVRPTDHSIEVTLASSFAGSAVVEHWRDGSSDTTKSSPVSLKPGTIAQVPLNGLTPGGEYRYRVGIARRDDSAAGSIAWGEEGRFRTRPAAGRSFTFTVQADSHLDQGVDPKAYEQTLSNMLSAKPDFVIDLGDTFMTDKRGPDFKSALPQYDAQRYYFSRVAHSAPLFMVLGNHDGEKGTSGKGADDIGPWSYAQRTSRFPEPIIDGTMYTGATSMTNGVGSNYYAFEWGDAMFIVLDPYWSTTERIRGGGGGNRGAGAGGQRGNDEPLKPTDSSWSSTLGRTQYDWLTRTLEGTKAKYRFVFIHHLVGGLGGAESRGGVESSPYFEWGGKNADGSPGFAEHRAGWSMPIHDLLVKHRVSGVFHGHDHLYVHSQRDGIVYQCVPQPGNLRGNTRTAAQYGYTSGTLHGSPGHLRVRVEPTRATVEFVRTALAEGGAAPERGRRGAEAREPNGAVVDSYTIDPVRTGK